ncbi:hypothetical protein FN846DRAFT_627999 [Sphaerosporella brunnea]|uniref:Uncharacterized protein n=1 Tax=Sphaerosporella brunnea TaxID=1250544 RepID=A0A5J5F0M9_9PEZI|nr:hypothetical protein FN846DRAFT_627999 [Sphaerosporella brunnea]
MSNIHLVQVRTATISIPPSFFHLSITFVLVVSVGSIALLRRSLLQRSLPLLVIVTPNLPCSHQIQTDAGSDIRHRRKYLRIEILILQARAPQVQPNGLRKEHSQPKTFGGQPKGQNTRPVASVVVVLTFILPYRSLARPTSGLPNAMLSALNTLPWVLPKSSRNPTY